MKENKYKRELTQLMHVIVPSVVRELDFVEQMFWWNLLAKNLFKMYRKV